MTGPRKPGKPAEAAPAPRPAPKPDRDLRELIVRGRELGRVLDRRLAPHFAIPERDYTFRCA